MNLTFIGLGDMGSQMVPHLVKANHHVTIWDRDSKKMAQVKEKQPAVLVATTLEEAVKASEVIITSVMSDDVLDLHIGSEQTPGITNFIQENAILVVTSTLDPEKINLIEREMPAQTELIDAPMIGGVKYARNGEIVFIVGGKEVPFKRVESILSVMGTVEYAGVLGNGAKLKLITNDGIMAAEAGIRETLDLADAYGIDYDITLKLLTMGPLKAVVLRALDETNPRPLKDSVADVDELLRATEKLAELSIAKNARDRLRRAVDEADGEAQFIDLTNKNTALPDYKENK